MSWISPWKCLGVSLLGGVVACGGGGDDEHDTFMTCIAAGTLVATPRGERPIEALAIGDVVWSVDPTTGAHVEARITAVRSARRECLTLRLGDGELVCTSTHPLYDPATGEYAEAGEWIEGKRHQLLRVAEDGLRAVEVTAREVYVGVHEVFDLTVDVDLHNFVAGGVLVHNKSVDPCVSDPALCNASTGPGTGTSLGSSGDTGGGSGDASGSGTGAATTGTDTGTGSDTGTATGTGVCEPPTDDASAIGTSCEGGAPCPDGYVCQPFNGFALMETCEILCEADCGCPAGTTCQVVQDKVAMWMQCMP